jgi:hypothetical protein
VVAVAAAAETRTENPGSHASLLSRVSLIEEKKGSHVHEIL